MSCNCDSSLYPSKILVIMICVSYFPSLSFVHKYNCFKVKFYILCGTNSSNKDYVGEQIQKRVIMFTPKARRKEQNIKFMVVVHMDLYIL